MRFVRDVESGSYFDPDKLHVLDHKGKYLSVRGPLNIARPDPGLAGHRPSRSLGTRPSTCGRNGGSWCSLRNRASPRGEQFYADVKSRAEKVGRTRDHLKILPGCFVVVGDTVEEARAKRAKLDSLVHYSSAIGSLSIALGHDASKFDPDGPLPDIPESNASKSGQQRAIDLAKRENLTVRQLAQRLGGHSGLAMVGTPATIADEMEKWLRPRLGRLHDTVSISSRRA